MPRSRKSRDSLKVESTSSSSGLKDRSSDSASAHARRPSSGHVRRRSRAGSMGGRSTKSKGRKKNADRKKVGYSKILSLTELCQDSFPEFDENWLKSVYGSRRFDEISELSELRIDLQMALDETEEEESKSEESKEPSPLKGFRFGRSLLFNKHWRMEMDSLMRLHKVFDRVFGEQSPSFVAQFGLASELGGSADSPSMRRKKDEFIRRKLREKLMLFNLAFTPERTLGRVMKDMARFERERQRREDKLKKHERAKSLSIGGLKSIGQLSESDRIETLRSPYHAYTEDFEHPTFEWVFLFFNVWYLFLVRLGVAKFEYEQHSDVAEEKHSELLKSYQRRKQELMNEYGVTLRHQSRSDEKESEMTMKEDERPEMVGVSPEFEEACIEQAKLFALKVKSVKNETRVLKESMKTAINAIWDCTHSVMQCVWRVLRFAAQHRLLTVHQVTNITYVFCTIDKQLMPMRKRRWLNYKRMRMEQQQSSEQSGGVPSTPWSERFAASMNVSGLSEDKEEAKLKPPAYLEILGVKRPSNDLGTGWLTEFILCFDFNALLWMDFLSSNLERDSKSKYTMEEAELTRGFLMPIVSSFRPKMSKKNKDKPWLNFRHSDQVLCNLWVKMFDSVNGEVSKIEWSHSWAECYLIKKTVFAECVSENLKIINAIHSAMGRLGGNEEKLATVVRKQLQKSRSICHHLSTFIVSMIDDSTDLWYAWDKARNSNRFEVSETAMNILYANKTIDNEILVTKEAENKANRAVKQGTIGMYNEMTHLMYQRMPTNQYEFLEREKLFMEKMKVKRMEESKLRNEMELEQRAAELKSESDALFKTKMDEFWMEINEGKRVNSVDGYEGSNELCRLFFNGNRQAFDNFIANTHFSIVKFAKPIHFIYTLQTGLKSDELLKSKLSYALGEVDLSFEYFLKMSQILEVFAQYCIEIENRVYQMDSAKSSKLDSLFQKMTDPGGLANRIINSMRKSKMVLLDDHLTKLWTKNFIYKCLALLYDFTQDSLMSEVSKKTSEMEKQKKQLSVKLSKSDSKKKKGGKSDDSKKLKELDSAIDVKRNEVLFERSNAWKQLLTDQPKLSDIGAAKRAELFEKNVTKREEYDRREKEDMMLKMGVFTQPTDDHLREIGIEGGDELFMDDYGLNDEFLPSKSGGMSIVVSGPDEYPPIQRGRGARGSRDDPELLAEESPKAEKTDAEDADAAEDSFEGLDEETRVRVLDQIRAMFPDMDLEGFGEEELLDAFLSAHSETVVELKKQREDEEQSRREAEKAAKEAALEARRSPMRKSMRHSQLMLPNVLLLGDSDDHLRQPSGVRGSIGRSLDDPDFLSAVLRNDPFMDEDPAGYYGSSMGQLTNAGVEPDDYIADSDSSLGSDDDGISYKKREKKNLFRQRMKTFAKAGLALPPETVPVSDFVALRESHKSSQINGMIKYALEWDFGRKMKDYCKEGILVRGSSSEQGGLDLAITTGGSGNTLRNGSGSTAGMTAGDSLDEVLIATAANEESLNPSHFVWNYQKRFEQLTEAISFEILAQSEQRKRKDREKRMKDDLWRLLFCQLINDLIDQRWKKKLVEKGGGWIPEKWEDRLSEEILGESNSERLVKVLGDLDSLAKEYLADFYESMLEPLEFPSDDLVKNLKGIDEFIPKVLENRLQAIRLKQEREEAERLKKEADLKREKELAERMADEKQRMEEYLKQREIAAQKAAEEAAKLAESSVQQFELQWTKDIDPSDKAELDAFMQAARYVASPNEWSFQIDGFDGWGTISEAKVIEEIYKQYPNEEIADYNRGGIEDMDCVQFADYVQSLGFDVQIAHELLAKGIDGATVMLAISMDVDLSEIANIVGFGL